MLQIKQIELNNWMPFNGKHVIDFSIDNKKNITLIRADNESGKTSLLKGIFWVLYGNEYFKKFKKEPANKRINRAAKKEGKFKHSIEVRFVKDEKTVHITREADLSANKDPNIAANFNENLLVNIDGQVERDLKAQSIINELIFEEEISRFFLFDGEMLKEYESLISGEDRFATEKIKKPIEDVLRITTLRYALNAIKDVQKDASNLFTKDEGNAENARLAQSSIRVAKEELTAFNDERTNVNKDIKKFEKRSDELERILSDPKNTEKNELLKDRKEVKGKIEVTGKSIKEKQDLISESIQDVEKDFLKKFKNNLLAQFEAEKEKIDAIKNDSIEQSIYQNLIANNEISDDSKRIIEKYITKDASEENVNDVYEIHQKIKKIKSSVTHETNKSEIIRTEEELKKLMDSKVLLDSELRRIDEKIKDDKDNNDNDDIDLESIVSEFGKCKEKIGKLKKELDENDEGTIARKIKDKEKEIKLLEDAVPDSSGNTFSAVQLDVANSLEKIFTESINDLTEESKQSIEENANDIYLKLRENRITSEKRLVINDNYGLEVLIGDDVEPLKDSSGAYQAIGLSLILALRNKAGIKAPLMMDTPLARLDKKYREKVLEYLPKYTTQYIILPRPGEIEAHSEEEELIKPKIGKKLKIQKIDDTRSQIKNE